MPPETEAETALELGTDTATDTATEVIDPLAGIDLSGIELSETEKVLPKGQDNPLFPHFKKVNDGLKSYKQFGTTDEIKSKMEELKRLNGIVDAMTGAKEAKKAKFSDSDKQAMLSDLDEIIPGISSIGHQLGKLDKIDNYLFNQRMEHANDVLNDYLKEAGVAVPPNEYDDFCKDIIEAMTQKQKERFFNGDPMDAIRILEPYYGQYSKNKGAANSLSRYKKASVEGDAPTTEQARDGAGKFIKPLARMTGGGNAPKEAAAPKNMEEADIAAKRFLANFMRSKPGT